MQRTTLATHVTFVLASLLLAAAGQTHATGLASCESGPKEGWQPQAKLEEALKAKGWTVRKVKVDGGCYEVYGLDDKGQRVEVYFHPVTLEPVPTRRK
jgi:hypothetical protein